MIRILVIVALFIASVTISSLSSAAPASLPYLQTTGSYQVQEVSDTHCDDMQRSGGSDSQNDMACATHCLLSSGLPQSRLALMSSNDIYTKTMCFPYEETFLTALRADLDPPPPRLI